jgi:type I restriction enzyme S subunit
MTVREVRIGAVLRPNRRWIEVDDLAEYVAIGIRAFGRGIFHYEPTVGSDLGKLRFFRVQPDSLVVSNIKAWEGAVGVSGWSEDGTIASNRFLSYEPIDDQADVHFLRHYFLTEEGNQRLQRASPGSADRNRTLAASRFEDILVPLPSPPEQRRIAARLDRIASVEAFPSPTAHLDRAIHALLREGPERPLAVALDLELNDFPVDRDALYERAGVLSFGRGLFTHGPMRGSQTKYAKLRYVHAGQLVMSRLKAFEGAVAVATPGFDGTVVSQEFVTFRPKAGVDPNWVDSLCRWPYFWDALRATSTGIGARRERVGADALLSLRVPYPGTTSLRRIAALNRSRLHVAGLEAEREQIRAAILPSARNEAFARLT